jgi:hypothetical protein
VAGVFATLLPLGIPYLKKGPGLRHLQRMERKGIDTFLCDDPDAVINLLSEANKRLGPQPKWGVQSPK